MSILLTSFFISLVGISTMIGRRLVVIKNKQTINAESFAHDFAIEVPDLEEVKDVTSKNLRNLGFVLLVATLRIYILSLDFLKKKYKILKNKIKEARQKRMGKLGNMSNISEEREANKFLQMMSEYKTKIRKIKRKIREEEGLN